MKYLLLASALIIPAQIFSMDNPAPSIRVNEDNELRASLSSSFGHSDGEDDRQNVFDYEADYPDNSPQVGSPGLPFILDNPTKEERKEIKQKDNAELMRLARQMLAHDGNLNFALRSGRWSSNTLLTAAAEHTCHKNVLEFALANGANPNYADNRGNTPLKVAVAAYCTDNITLLLNRGALLNDQTLLGDICSPLFTKIGPKRIAALKALLDAGANPNHAVVSPLHKLEHTPCLLSGLLCHSRKKLEGQEYDSFVTHHKEMIAILLQAGLNLFKKDAQGKTDWEKILECKDKFNKYNSELFNFVQKRIIKSAP